MDNLYDTIKLGLHFNKFEIEELLFVEYNCPIEDAVASVWNHTDLIVHVLSGQKTWRSLTGDWTVRGGESLYIKKGANLIQQSFDEEFCMLGFFVSDEFIRNLIKEISGKMIVPPRDSVMEDSIFRVQKDIRLDYFFQSMLTYFHGSQRPSDSLLILKLKEFLINVLTGRKNVQLANYFQSLAGSDSPSVREIMETNFCYNLSLEEFAKLCHRSLSTFKRDFIKYFDEPPGKWLLGKRLEYSSVLLKCSDLNISQVVFESGFENPSHFSRAFKDKFGVNPTDFRKDLTTIRR